MNTEKRRSTWAEKQKRKNTKTQKQKSAKKTHQKQRTFFGRFPSKHLRLPSPIDDVVYLDRDFLFLSRFSFHFDGRRRRRSRWRSRRRSRRRGTDRRCRCRLRNRSSRCWLRHFFFLPVCRRITDMVGYKVQTLWIGVDMAQRWSRLLARGNENTDLSTYRYRIGRTKKICSCVLRAFGKISS